MAGKLYLLPVPLGDSDPWRPDAFSITILQNIKYIVAEKSKPARKWFKLFYPGIDQSSLEILEISRSIDRVELNKFFKATQQGENILLVSDAGCPGVADPGAKIVAEAHKNDINVVPLVGPSSIIMGLMASGLNGQQFKFNGYLPIKKGPLVKKIRQLIKLVQEHNETQIFIETPYRNNNLVQVLLKECPNMLYLSIAANINTPEMQIQTMLIKDWQKDKIELHKQPAVFLIGNI